MRVLQDCWLFSFSLFSLVGGEARRQTCRHERNVREVTRWRSHGKLHQLLRLSHDSMSSFEITYLTVFVAGKADVLQFCSAPPPSFPSAATPPLILCSHLILVCLSTIFSTIMACRLLPIRTIIEVSSLLLFQGDLQSQGPDPFYELESHTLIGVANIFMDCLHYNIPLEYSPPIIDPRGEVGVKCSLPFCLQQRVRMHTDKGVHLGTSCLFKEWVWSNCFSTWYNQRHSKKKKKKKKKTGAVRITSWYPKINGSHFGLPPSSIHRMTGLGGKFVWSKLMMYSHWPHCNRQEVKMNHVWSKFLEPHFIACYSLVKLLKICCYLLDQCNFFGLCSFRLCWSERLALFLQPKFCQRKWKKW